MACRHMEGWEHEDAPTSGGDGEVLNQHAYLVAKAARMQCWVDDEVVVMRLHGRERHKAKVVASFLVQGAGSARPGIYPIPPVLLELCDGILKRTILKRIKAVISIGNCDSDPAVKV